MSIDPYYTFNVETVEVIRLRKSQHWITNHRFKHYVESATGKERQIEDHRVFRNERDAAIALAQAMTQATKELIAKAQIKQQAIAVVIQQYDIGDCPYLVLGDGM